MAPLQLKQAGMQFVQPLNEGLLRGPDGIPNLDGHVFWQNCIRQICEVLRERFLLSLQICGNMLWTWVSLAMHAVRDIFIFVTDEDNPSTSSTSLISSHMCSVTTVPFLPE